LEKSPKQKSPKGKKEPRKQSKASDTVSKASDDSGYSSK